MLTDLRKTPFPWFGGRSRRRACRVGSARGRDHYVGLTQSASRVLLRRPHGAVRTTVDRQRPRRAALQRLALDSGRGHRRRSIMAGVRADKHARHLALLRWPGGREHVMADPRWHDPRWRAGGCGGALWIGGGVVLWRKAAGSSAALTAGLHPSNEAARGAPQGVWPATSGQGVAPREPGNDGKGVARPQMREPGVGEESSTR